MKIIKGPSTGFILSTFLGLLQKILNLKLSFKIHFFVQISQGFIVYMLKRKLAVFHCLFISPV